MNYYFDVLKKYADYTGRAERKEFWFFNLFNVIICIVISLIPGFAGAAFSLIYNLAILIPAVCVSIRRMHDVDKSGWYILLPFYNIVLFCTDSVKGANRFGDNPKGIKFPSDNTDDVINVPSDENEIIAFFDDKSVLFKSRGSVIFYSVMFIISLFLSLIIPFMYFTLVEPIPLNPDSISIMDTLSFMNIVNIIVYVITFTIIFFKDYPETVSNYVAKLKSYSSLTPDDQKYLLDDSIRKYYTVKNVMLFVLFIPFWSSLMTAFIHVTGPLVLSHKIYFFNNIFLLLYLVFIISFFPSSRKAIKFYKENCKSSMQNSK